jgi:hypothetical protein
MFRGMMLKSYGSSFLRRHFYPVSGEEAVSEALRWVKAVRAG